MILWRQLFQKKRCWAFLYYSIKIFVEIVINAWKLQKVSDLKTSYRQQLVKTPTFGFIFYKESIFFQYFFEMIGATILLISTFVIFILEIKSRRDLRLTYATISSLSDATQINIQYSNLDSYGYDWYIRFRALVIINTIMICFFIQDWLQYLSFIKIIENYKIFWF